MRSMARTSSILVMVWAGAAVHYGVRSVQSADSEARLFRRHGTATNKQVAPENNGTVTAASCYEASAGITKDMYPLCSVLEPARVVMYWDHDGNSTHKATSLHVAVVAKTSNDWVAVGFNGEAEGMIGTDVAMLRKDKDGEYRMEDRFAVAYAMPMLDEKQDKTLTFLETRPADPALVFGFMMPVDSMDTLECRRDKEDAILDSDRWAYVMWAMGDNQDDQPQYHGATNRGATTLPLFSSPTQFAAQTAPVTVPDPSTTVDIFLPDLEMPVDDAYRCTYWETPQDAKYHVYDAQILGDRDFVHSYVHHMFLYQIDVPYGRAKFPPGQMFPCELDSPQSHGIPLVMSSHLALTPSPQPLAEVDAGYPLGKGYARYWMLEVHLYNPNHVSGARGSPGFKMTFSPILRTHDAGVVYTGAVPTSKDLNRTSNLAIPPGMDSFDFVSYCPSICTERLVQQPEGVHIIYLRLHMHELGKNGEVQLIRNATRPGASDNSTAVSRDRVHLSYLEHWDFENQQGTSFEPPGVPLYPGDRLITRCTYDSQDKTNVTVWGDTHTDEMCVAYLVLYPMPDSAACLDLRGTHDPAMDYFASLGTPLNMSFCTMLDQYSNASSSYNYHDYEMYIYQHGLALNIPADELDAKETWTDNEYFSQTCHALTSVDKTHGRRLLRGM